MPELKNECVSKLAANVNSAEVAIRTVILATEAEVQRPAADTMRERSLEIFRENRGETKKRNREKNC